MKKTTKNEPEKNTSPKLPVAPENAVTFEMYKLWKTIPIRHMLLMKGVTMEGILEDLCIDDPLLREVMAFKTQNEWGARFDININTLTEWNKKIKGVDALLQAKVWLQPLTKNVMFNIYRRAATGSDPFMAKLYLQTVQDWQEKNTLNVNVPPTRIVFSPMAPKQVASNEVSIKKPKKVKSAIKQHDTATHTASNK